MIYDSKTLAKAWGRNPRRVHQLAQKIIAAGHGEKQAGRFIFYESALNYLKNRADTRKVSHEDFLRKIENLPKIHLKTAINRRYNALWQHTKKTGDRSRLDEFLEWKKTS